MVMVRVARARDDAQVTKLLDTDGDGHIGLQEFEEALEVMQKANGVHGAPWKLYVDPAQVCVWWCHGVVTVGRGVPWRAVEALSVDPAQAFVVCRKRRSRWRDGSAAGAYGDRHPSPRRSAAMKVRVRVAPPSPQRKRTVTPARLSLSRSPPVA